MHARHMFRAFAAVTLAAALSVSGAVGASAQAPEPLSVATTAPGDEALAAEAQLAAATDAAVPATDPAPASDAPPSVAHAEIEQAQPDIAEGDAEPASPGATPEGDAPLPEPTDAALAVPPSAAAAHPEGEGEAEPTPGVGPEDSEEEPATLTDVTLALTTVVSAQESLAVRVRAEGFPEGTTGVSAALIVRGTEAVLTGPESQIPAVATPQPEIRNGFAAFTLSAPVDRLTRGARYQVVMWTDAAQPAQSIFARAEVSVATAQWDQLLGAPPQSDWNHKSAVGSFDWGVRKNFREYVTGPIAKGKITVQAPAKGTDTYRFPQSANTWDPKTLTGTANYAGNVNFWGHDGVLDLNLTNPQVTVRDAAHAELHVPYEGKSLKIATIDLAAKSATRNVLPDGSVRFKNAKVTLTQAGLDVYFEEYMSADMELAPLTFTVGADSQTDKPVKPPVTKPGTQKPKPKPKPEVKPLPPVVSGGDSGGAQAAGSLSWGVSSSFASYVTGPIAKGAVSTSGVGSSGGAYLFPQAAGGSWDPATQTGSVQYSGVVSFTGHKGLLSESMSNPLIQVTGPDTGVIYNGGAQWGTLNLGAATKSVGANGEVTWSGVPVSGGFSGGASGSSQYTLGADPLTFTVGVASGVSYGSTEVSNESLKRTAAASAPTTAGIRVLTDPKKIVPGGELEFEAPGFTPKEREILVVLYPGTLVLDEVAGADASGTVRWLGTLPEDLPLGEYVITLQGSADAGSPIEVRAPEPAKKAAAQQKQVAELAAQTAERAPVAAGAVPEPGSSSWLWWVASLTLLAVAGTMGSLVAVQRRNAGSATVPGPVSADVS